MFTTEKHHIWRQDITGLRALAVIPVLIFHAFPDVLPGGFYGVDIFFVISGYLISGIIFRGLCNGSFSFKDFYIKRIKRIIPNLVTVLAFVAVVGWLIATTEEYKKIGANISHSALFYQNFGLMRGEGYFDVLAQNNPLLHIWSLAIEEQFYLFFPLLCFAIWKIGKYSVRALGVFVILITVASLICCFSIENNDVRFYFPLSRFWELGIGICVAYAEIFYRFNVSHHSQKFANLLSVVGLLFVSIAFLVPARLYSSPPPGVFNLIVVCGSASLIFANTRAVVNRTILSWRWMLFVGLISYSLYLWHWPLLAYMRLYIAYPTWLEIAAILIISLVLSIFVYKYIENPIRSIKNTSTFLLVGVLVVSLLISYCGGKLIRKMDGFEDREIVQSLDFAEDWSYPAELQDHSDIRNLKITNKSVGPQIVFIGDSHMEQYHARVIDIARKTKTSVGFFTGGGCFASIGKSSVGKRCANANHDLEKIFLDPNLRILVFSQKWGGYKNNGILSEGIEGYLSIVNKFLEFDRNRRVYVLLDNPWSEDKNGEFDIFRYLGSRYNVEEKINTGSFIVSLPKNQEWKEGNEFLLGKFLQKDFKNNVIFINTQKYICPNGVCDLKDYRDNDHLRSSYVRDNAFWIDQIFRK